MKKTFSFLLALCLLLSLLPVGAYATDAGAVPAGGQGEISASGTLDIDESILPDSQEILDSYAQSMLYPQYTMSLFSLGPDRLGDARQQYIYNQLKDWISQVAVGEKPAYLKIEIPSTPELSWTYKELGISDPAAESLEDIFYDKAGINKIIDTLMVDMPYELYWFDKSQGNGASCYFSLNYDGSKVQLTGMEFIFSVIDSYKSTESYTVTWGANVYTYYKVNSTKFNSVQNAVVKAQNIVQANAGLSDYEKLLAYKNAICDLTEYDYNAASAKPVQYGDPWQIINVFDGDPNTKVVCEGYSKAFQYLCDKSTFQDINTVCYTVMGYLSGGGLSNPEGHMWNIVSLGGKNYLVDVTNSDAGTKGENGQLFLAGASGSPESEYTISLGNETLRYNYSLMSQEMKDMMGNALVLSDKNYDPDGTTEPECSHEWEENGIIKAATCTEAGEMEYKCSICGETKNESIEALGHDWSAWTSADENNHSRTCMRDGCGATETGEHSWDEGTVTKEPTATEAGVRTFTCTVCQATKTEEIAATGTTEPAHTHSWSSDWKYDDNYHWHDCTADGCDIKDNSGKNGYAAHTWDEGTVTKEPTATEAGVRTFTCTVCQATKTEEIAATGTTEPTHTHNWSSDWKYDDNYHWHECTADGCDITENSGKNGYAAHNRDEGKVTKEPSTTEKGIKTYTCKDCGAEKTEEIPMLEHQHSWSTEWTKNDQFHWHDCTAQGCTETDNSKKNGFGTHSWDSGKVLKAATTSAAGTMEYKCTVCGFVKTEQIPILPTPQHDHVWSSAWTYNNTNHWHECTASGCTLSNAADKYGYAPHSFGAWRTVKEATATTEGLMEHQCQCGYKESKTIPVKTQSQCNHNWSGWTFNYPNYWERTCSICHARDIQVTQVAQPKITSGANAVWRQGSSNGLSFTSDAPVSEFKSVTLNGFTLNSSYYTVTEGSTIVTLKKSCLDQLGVGTHRLGIVSSGGTAETTFTVKAKTILNNQTPTYNSSKPWTTPKTGDSANMGLWIGMIAVCAVGLGGVALYVVKFKKNKRN